MARVTGVVHYRVVGNDHNAVEFYNADHPVALQCAHSITGREFNAVVWPLMPDLSREQFKISGWCCVHR